MFFCLPVHFETYTRTVPFTLKSENRKKCHTQSHSSQQQNSY